MSRDRQAELDYDDAPHAGAYDYRTHMPDPIPVPIPVPTPGLPWWQDRKFLAAVLAFLAALLSNWQTNGVSSRQTELGAEVQAIKADVKAIKVQRPLVYAKE